MDKIYAQAKQQYDALCDIDIDKRTSVMTGIMNLVLNKAEMCIMFDNIPSLQEVCNIIYVPEVLCVLNCNELTSIIANFLYTERGTEL